LSAVEFPNLANLSARQLSSAVCWCTTIQS
jgi:hypothetical protein